jgi:3-oxoadipate enol-lactonase/4-carboxymuconolactone decarboxylase
VTDSLLPSITVVRMSGVKHRAELPVLVLGPAYGASASSLWAGCAAQLGAAFDLLAWDLPGHGYNVGVPREQFTVAELAAGVLAVVDDVLAERGELGGSFAYAGVGVGSEVGEQLELDAPERVSSVVELGDVDPADAPEDVARLIYRQLLGVALPEERSGATDRLVSALMAEVESARGGGLTTEEIRVTLQRVAAELGD